MNNKVAIWSVAGVVAAGTVAYLYDWWNKSSKRKYVDFDKKIKDLKTIRDPKGELNVQAVTRLMTYVNEESEKEFNRAAQSLQRQRRMHLKSEDYDEYLEVAQECLELQREVEEEYLQRALGKLGVDRDEYEEELTKMPPQALQMIMANKGAKPMENVEVPYHLTKGKTKEIFYELSSLQDRSNDKWKPLFEKLEALVLTMDQMTAGSMMMGIMQYLSGDILHNNYDITEEEYAAALQQYKTMEDPEIVRVMQQKAAMYNMMSMMGAGQ